MAVARRAADYLERSSRTIHGWNTSGLLPNTRAPAEGNRLYLRANLDRVRHAPRRGDKQIDRKVLLEQTATRRSERLARPLGSDLDLVGTRSAMMLDVVTLARSAQAPSSQGGPPNAAFFIVGGIILLAVIITVAVNISRRCG